MFTSKNTQTLLAAVLATLALQVTAQTPPPSDATLVAQLLTANTQVTRIADVANDTEFVFDFMNGARGTALGGFAVSANAANFPALLTGNGAMTVGVMGPCGANSPHTHPRATELQIVVQGGPVYTQFVMENGARTVSNTVPVGSATIFPKGSMHFQQNMGCEPTVFIASFDTVDPGTLQIAQNFFALNQGVVNATLGDVGVSFLDHLSLPENFILGAQECLDRCGIDRSTFNFTASFKDYAIFSNSTWGTAPALPSSVSSMYGVPTSTGSTSSKLVDAVVSSSGAIAVGFNQNPLRGAVIGLGVTVIGLALGVIGLLVAMKRQGKQRRSGVQSFAPGFGAGARGYPYATPYDSEAMESTRSLNK